MLKQRLTPADPPGVKPQRLDARPRERLHLPSLGLRASERLMLLALVDVSLLIASLAVAVATRTAWLDEPGAFFALWRWWFTLAVVWWLISQLLEAYDLARAASAPHSMLAAGSAAALTVLVYQMIPVLTPPLGSRGLSLLFAGLAIASVATWRGLYAVLFVQPAFETCALVLGAGGSGSALAAALTTVRRDFTPNPYHGTGYRIVAFVDDDPNKLGERIGRATVLGASPELLRLARELRVDEVVLAITNREIMQQSAFDALMACREDGFHVTTMETVYERVLGRVSVEHSGRNIAAVLPVADRGPTERLYGLMKRLADLLFAAVALIPFALAIALVALLNLACNRGALFYRQTRVGKGGRTFEIYKFRTMRPDAEALTGAVWASPADPRITPVGRFLRKTRIDELPQVLNVLSGHMSVIGPRPERPEFVERLARQIPFYKARHAVRPGLTGWAQVRFGYGSTVEDARTKLEYDLYYVRHSGFYLDALITLKTAAVMFKLQGK